MNDVNAAVMDTLYATLSWVLVAAYAVAPVAAVVYATVQHRRGRKLPAIRFAATATVGILLGVMLCVAYGFGIGGRAGWGQVLLTAYLAVALLLLLKAGDFWLQRLLLGKNPQRRRKWIAGIARLAVLLLVGLPAVMAAVMTFRVKVVPQVTPASELGVPYEEIAFDASDGTHLAGWWIPALQRPGTDTNATRTVVLAHGLGGGKADFLPMAAQFVPYGYNVLMLDCRAHGESGGQRSTFGKLETLDVAAALRWAKANKPTASQQLFGVGASMGGAALLGAAADDPDVDAVAVIGTYDDLAGMAGDATARIFSWPISTVAKWVALPLASAHAGTDLADFRPADAAARLWPRPLLVIHAQNDEMIPFRRGETLYQSASEPKRQWWSSTGGHNDLLNSDDVGAELRMFFDNARPVPVAWASGE